MHNVSWLKQNTMAITSFTEQDLCGEKRALCLTLVGISVFLFQMLYKGIICNVCNTNLIMKLLTGGCFQTLPLPTLDKLHPQTVSEVSEDCPIFSYSEIHLHNIWKREQISGSVNTLAIRALWEMVLPVFNGLNQSDKSLTAWRFETLAHLQNCNNFTDVCFDENLVKLKVHETWINVFTGLTRHLYWIMIYSSL